MPLKKEHSADGGLTVRGQKMGIIYLTTYALNR